MDKARMSENAIVTRYRSALAAVCVLALFSGADQFVYSISPIPPLAWLAIGGLLTLPLIARRLVVRQIPTPRLVILASCMLALGLYGWWISDHGTIAVHAFREWILSVLILLMCAEIFSEPQAVRAARYAVVVVVAISVPLAILSFFGINGLSHNICRGGALYGNPNTTAVSLVLGAIVATDMLSPKWRELFLTLVLVGVCVTVSRGGYVVWLLAAAGMILTKQLRWRTLLKLVGAAAALAAVAYLGARTFAILPSCLRPADVSYLAANRFSTSPADDSLYVRTQMLQTGLRGLAKSGWVGAGIGYPLKLIRQHMGLTTGTQILYLDMALQFGVLGIVLIVLTMYLMLHTNFPGSIRPATFVVVWLAWSCLDSDMFLSISKVVIMALQMAMVSGPPYIFDGGNLLRRLRRRLQDHGLAGNFSISRMP